MFILINTSGQCKINDKVVSLVSDTVKNDTKNVSSSSNLLNEQYTQQFENVLNKNIYLVKLRNELNDSLSKIKKYEKSLLRESKSLKVDINKNKNKISKLLEEQKESGIDELTKRKVYIESSICNNIVQIDKLNENLDTLKGKLDISKGQEEQLNRIRDDISSQLIDEYQEYIELPFSKITLEELKLITDKCYPYIIDSNIKDFIEKVESKSLYKNIYIEIQKIINSPFQKLLVTQSLEKIKSMQGLSAYQSEEIFEIQKQLESFEEGLHAFKTYINNLNKCRNGVNYSLQYYQDDEEQILPVELKHRINNKLLLVPYLRTKYEEFLIIFKDNPNCHSDIEMEILKQ